MAETRLEPGDGSTALEGGEGMANWAEELSFPVKMVGLVERDLMRDPEIYDGPSPKKRVWYIGTLPTTLTLD